MKEGAQMKDSEWLSKLEMMLEQLPSVSDKELQDEQRIKDLFIEYWNARPNSHVINVEKWTHGIVEKIKDSKDREPCFKFLQHTLEKSVEVCQKGLIAQDDLERYISGVFDYVGKRGWDLWTLGTDMEKMLLRKVIEPEALILHMDKFPEKSIFAGRDIRYADTRVQNNLFEPDENDKITLSDLIDALIRKSRSNRHRSSLMKFESHGYPRSLLKNLRKNHSFVSALDWAMQTSFLKFIEEKDNFLQFSDEVLDNIKYLHIEPIIHNWDVDRYNVASHIHSLTNSIKEKAQESERKELSRAPDGFKICSPFRHTCPSLYFKIWKEILATPEFDYGAAYVVGKLLLDFNHEETQEYLDLLTELFATEYSSRISAFKGKRGFVLNPSVFYQDEVIEEANTIKTTKRAYKLMGGVPQKYDSLLVSTESKVRSRNWLSDSTNLTCVLGPNGPHRKTALLYELDPYVGVLRLIAYNSETENESNIGENAIGFCPIFQVYNTSDELCWLVDGVDVGVEAYRSGKEWMSVFKKGILQAANDVRDEKPRRVYFNTFARNTASRIFVNFIKQDYEGVKIKLRKREGNRPLVDAGIPNAEHFIEAFQYKEDGSVGTMWLKDDYVDGEYVPREYTVKVVEVEL